MLPYLIKKATLKDYYPKEKYSKVEIIKDIKRIFH